MFRTILPALSLILAAGPLAAQGVDPTRDEADAFVLADADANLLLTFPEFRTFVRAMAAAGQPTARQIRFFGAYRYAFGIADADGNGLVTPLELRSADNDFRAQGN